MAIACSRPGHGGRALEAVRLLPLPQNRMPLRRARQVPT
jgi:hypothetical protein